MEIMASACLGWPQNINELKHCQLNGIGGNVGVGRTAGGNTTSRRISPSSSLLGELDMGVLCCGDFFNATEWTHVHGNAEVKLNELVGTVGPVADRFGRGGRQILSRVKLIYMGG